MAKTSKGVILSQASQIKSDYSFALIKATADNKSLVQDASSAELKVNALVEYSKDSQWDPKELSHLGFPAGCFLIVDLRGQDIHAADLITNLALVRQYGYQAGVIDDLSTLDDIKVLKTNQIYLINSGKANDDQDASLNGDEITDDSGKLAVGMSVKWQRDYTNVDVSGDHAGFVGMGQDTLLKGGNAFGYSTNGRDFNAVITPKGLIFRRPDAERMWRLLKPNEIADINSTVGDKVKKEVDSATAEIPAAVSAANSAVSAAESAVAASKVNSDAIAAQSKAISEAKAAIDSATAEIQQTATNAASDAAKIRADVAQVQNEVDTAKAANSASVEALKSDVSAAKKDLADVHDSLTKAQSAIEQNQKLINDNVAKITSDVSATKQDLATVHDSLAKAQAAAEQNQKVINDSIAQINANVDATNQDLAGVRKDLTKAQADITANQKSINNNVAQINSDIAQDRKDIASAQQANANTAKQLDTYSKQAVEQGKTIKTIQDKQDGFTATLADVQGNVSQVSDKVDGLSASLKDAQGNVASVKAQADQLSATLTDHAKSIATLTASAKELSSTLEDADGRLSKVEQTAQTNSSTLSDVQGDLSQVKQDATTLTSTLKDAQGNISTLQQKADSVSAQLASAQGDIATLQTGVDGVKATLASHDKTIHTLQLDSKSLKDSMADAQGDISTLSKTATSLDSEMKDHAGRLSKVEQSAATQATTLSDLQGNLTQVKQQADGLVTTLKNAQGSITQIQQKADGTLEQLKSAQGDIASLQTDVTGIKATLVSHEGDIHTLQADSRTLKDDMTDAQGNISSLKKSATDLTSEMSSQDGRLSKVEQTAKEHTSTISDLGDKLSNLKVGGRNLVQNTSQDIVIDDTANANENGWYYANISLTQQPKVGDQLTISAEGTLTGKGDLSAYQIDLYNANATDKRSNDAYLAPGKRSSATLTVNNLTGSGDTVLLIYAGKWGDTEGKKLVLYHLKVEFGNVTTDWTPAPEDLATVTQVKQTADGIETTLKNAQGDIDQIKQTAKGTSEQLSNVQGNVTNIQKDVDGLKQTTADNAGNIHTLQSDSKTLKDDMQDAQGDISTLQKTSTSITSELKDHDGRISKTEQTAAEHTTEIADAQGNLSKVSQKADGLEKLVSDAQGDINDVKMTATGMESKITTQENDIAQIKANADQLSTRMSGVETTANNAKSSADSANGKIDGITSSGGGRNLWSGSKAFRSTNINQQTVTWSTGEDGVAVAHMTGNSCGFYGTWAGIYVDGKDPFSVGDKGTFSVEMKGTGTITIGREDNFTQAFNLTDQWQRYSVSGTVKYTNSAHIIYNESGKNVDAYIRLPMVEKGPVAHDWTPAPEDVSAKITANSTEIDQTKKAITLKADQSTVDNLSGEVSQNKAQLKVQADQINSKVSTIDFTALDGRTMQNRGTADSADFNTLTKPGFYTIINPWNGKNYPTDSWGTLEVSGQVSDTSGRLNQKFVSDYGGAIYTRQYNMTTKAWTAWQQSANQSDINSLNGKITSNKTAIDQTNKAISLKADQTEVDQIKNTATQNSSRLNVMANEISSKVTSTDVNNIVNSKGYATTSTVQSLITQKAGTINESITNLDAKYSAKDGVNLQTGTGDCSFPFTANQGQAVVEKYDDHTKMIHAYGSPSGFYLGFGNGCFIPDIGETYTISADIKGKGYIDGSGFKYEGSDSVSTNKVTLSDNWQRMSCTVHISQHSGTWIFYPIPGSGNNDFYVKHIKIEKGSVATPWTPAPSDNATVTQVQEITASIDGIQSTVANKADKSQITQLSNVIQSKVSSSDFNNLRKAVDLQTLDSADINNMKTNGHYFVHNLANNPVGGWVYVDVTGNGSDRIRQDVYQDSGNRHKYRRWFGNYWTNWEEGATYTEITQLQDAINLRVKSGDLLSQINIQAGQTLIQSGKIYMDADSVIMGPNTKAFIPSAAIVNLDVAKLNAGTINTDRIHIGDDSVYLSVKNNYLRLDGSNTKDKYQLRLTGNDIEFADNDSSNWEYRIQHGITKYQTDEDGLDFDVYSKRGGANHTVMAVSDAGVMISPSLFFQTDGIDSSNWMGFTRNTVDGNSSVSFHTWDDNNEGFHVDCGARFMNYVYINGYARAQGWLTNSTLSKKMNIRKLDLQTALDKIRQDDQYLYEYKRNVAKGIHDPQASFIIDDIHDVAQYSVPREFIDQSGEYREPNVELAYLVAAFQALDKQVQSQQAEIKKLKEQLNND